jgi:hypothetical protein
MNNDSRLIFEAYNGGANDVLFTLQTIFNFIQRHKSTDVANLLKNFSGKDVTPFIKALVILSLVKQEGNVITAFTNNAQINYKPS